jgi:cytoskeletal protein RodZ
MEPQFQDLNFYRENKSRGTSPSVRFRVIEPSGNAAAVISSVGRELRETRRAKGLEISQVSNGLKISSHHLNAIEKSDIEAFPIGDTYLIGFARSYATYLGLDAGPYVEKLKSDIAEREARRRATDSQNQPQKNTALSAIRFVLCALGFSGYEL